MMILFFSDLGRREFIFRFKKILGRKALRNLKKNKSIKLKDLEIKKYVIAGYISGNKT